MSLKVTLAPLTEANMDAVLSMTVEPFQKKFVPSPAGIIARAWAHRDDNADLHVICVDDAPAGLILTWDMTEEPACHFLMEMFIDRSHQRKGVGTQALQMLIADISRAPRFPVIELSVDRENTAAIRLYEKAGFTDSGYTDPDLPQYINMIFPLNVSV